MSNFEEPLGQPFLDHLGTATLATAILHLFVGEHRLVLGAPLYRRFAPLGEIMFKELHEEPLRPVIIIRVAGDYFFTPIKGRAHRRELFAHPLHIFIGPLFRVLAILNCRIFGGQTERIEADGKEHVLPARP